MGELRAFVVEDNDIILESLTEALEEIDVEVVGHAGDQAEALAWFDARTNGCDVAIIDLFLASGSGIGVLEGMADYPAPPQRVVLTNYATPEMRKRCAALGADVTFDKSTEVAELLDWLMDRKQRANH